MKKRILSILLTLVMVIGMLPAASLTAHAAEKTTVTQIKLTGVHLPKVGNKCLKKDEAGVTTPSDAAYEFSPQYYAYWDITDTKLTSDNEFEAGQQYYTSFMVRIKDGFKDTHAFSAGSAPTIIFTDIDESLYKNYSVSFESIEDSYLRAKVYFTLAGDTVPINTLVLDDYKTPVNGESLASWYSPSDAPVYNYSKMTSLTYLMPDGSKINSSEYDKIMNTDVESGEEYGLEMIFEANENNTFADVVSISVGAGNPTITYTVSTDKKTLTVKLSEEVPSPDITSIEFGLISQAAVINGNTVEKYADYWVTESSDKYYAYFNAFWYEWKDEAGNIVTGQKFENGKKYIGKFDFRAETGHSFADDVTINITSGGKYVSHKVTGYSGSHIDLEVTVTPHIPLNFVNQSPAGSDGETTGLSATVGDTKTYTFNSTPAPDGFYVEKKATLKGLFAGLDADQSIPPVTDGSAATLTHTFENAGLYQLTETLKLYKEGESTPVETKTHVFLISVNKKPLVVPEITDQPESATKVTGSHELSATAKNADRARWYKIGSDGKLTALDTILNAGVATTTISSNTTGDRYYCAFWSVDNKIAQTDVVTVCFVPTVNSNGDVTVAAGNTAFLKVTERGCGHYADANGWYKDGVELTSGDKYYIMGTTLAVQNAAAEDAGTYTYKYVTEHGDEVTANVTLKVNTGSSSATIDTFDITGLDNPVILGTVADTSVSVPTGANYTVESVTWTAGVNGSGVVTGSSGVVSIKLKAKDGYTFNSGELAGTVEGINKKVYSVPADATEVTVYVDYNVSGSGWKIVYPENDTVSISTDSLTFKVGTAANGQKVEGTFNCTHKDLADTNLHHTGMKYEVYSGITDNEMPVGLTLHADGTITGTPDTAGIYTVQVAARSVNASDIASNCSGLAVKAIEIVVESDAHVHDWDYENPDSDSATCTADGVKVISCNGCPEKITVTSPATGHNWGEWNDGNPIITPRCTDGDLVIERICANDPTHTEEATIKGIHMGMDWTTDENYHWKVCVYCEEEIVYQPEPHADTNSDNKCDICEYDMTPEPGNTIISSVNLTGFNVPSDGDNASDGDPAATAESGKGYAFSYGTWFDSTGSTQFNGEFEADETYIALLALRAEEGYEFAPTGSISATVKDANGNTLTVKSVSVANASRANDAATVKVEFTIPAEGGEHTHTWGETTYKWAEDGSSCTAERVCTKDGTHKETATATITSAVKTPATETEMGWTTYTATFTESWATTQTKDVQDISVIPVTYTITFDANGGSVSPASKETGTDGKLDSLPTPTHSGSYSFDGWYSAKNGGTKITTSTVFTTDTTVYAHWTYTGGGGIVIPTVFPVNVKDSDNGEVKASAKYAAPGSTIKLTVTPDEGYELDTLTVKSGSKFIDVTEKNGKYQFVMPFGSATVTATFKKIETPVVPDPVVPSFDDVAEDTYYFDAVEWAVENGITTGTSDTTFSPDMTCTRAQAVTFLWRAAGSPEPKSNVMPFEDVAAEAYYYKAVLWAVENGITKGTSATTFSPDADCTRAQIVTFLWRAQKSPAAIGVNPFTDVAADAYYVDAVLWAVEEKVTNGTSATTFSPDADCTRAQIVTFLYRALNGEE